MDYKSIVKCIFPLLTILLLNNCSGNHPAAIDTPHIAAIDSLIEQAINLNHIPGAVVQVKQAGTILHSKAYGYALKYDEQLQVVDDPQNMTVAHMFDLASLTKVCGTTFGIMVLVDRGKIKPDTPIYTILPEFSEGAKRKITIRHLLTHTAGLYKWRPTYYHADNAKDRYEYIVNLPLKWPVGQGRHYSDLGFMLLGDIIQKVSGLPLDEFLQKNLFKPLGLEHTTFNPLEKGFTNIAATSHGNPFEKHMVYGEDFGYKTNVDPESWDGWRHYTLQGEVSDGNAWYANGGVAGHAGLFSNVSDIQVLVDLLLHKGNFNGEPFISEGVIDTFLTKDKFGNGLGWAMNQDFISAEGAPPGTFGHTGFTGTSIVVVPKYNLSIIILTNREQVGMQEDGYYYGLGSLRQHIFDAVMEAVKKK